MWDQARELSGGDKVFENGVADIGEGLFFGFAL